MVRYAEKEEKTFCFSSLCQMIQFGTINFVELLLNYFGQFVWIEKKMKKRVTVIVVFHFMKRRLKMRKVEKSDGTSLTSVTGGGIVVHLSANIEIGTCSETW